MWFYCTYCKHVLSSLKMAMVTSPEPCPYCTLYPYNALCRTSHYGIDELPEVNQTDSSEQLLYRVGEKSPYTQTIRTSDSI